MASSSNWRDLLRCLISRLNLTTFLLLFPIVVVSPGNAQTLKAVKERGVLNCGVSQGLLGFSNADDKNNWSGFDVDFCRAVAAAIFDDPSKVAFVPLDAPARFTALQSNKIDVLSRNTTWTMSRENSLGVLFAGIAFYDGQGFHAAPGCEDRYRPRTERQDGLRAVRHNYGIEPRGLLPCKQHVALCGDVSDRPGGPNRI